MGQLCGWTVAMERISDALSLRNRDVRCLIMPSISKSGLAGPADGRVGGSPDRLGRRLLVPPDIAAALRVERVDRRRAPRGPALYNREDGGQGEQSGEGRGGQAADDGAAERGGLLAALAQAE